MRVAQNAAQLDELRVVAGGDDDGAVGDWKFLIRHQVGMGIADALRDFAGDQIIERLERQRADGGIDQRSIDVAALAGLLAPRQRRQNADRRIDAGEDVGSRHADPHRRAVGVAGHAHDAADALRHEIVAGARRRRPGLAEAGHRAIDQSRIVSRQARVIEAELLQAADLEILDQHVGARHQFLDDALALGRGEIGLDRALAAIGAMKIGGAEMTAVGRLDEGRTPGARVVAGAGALDLDDVGAEIGEQLARPRTCQNPGQLQHAQTSQWTRHETLPTLRGHAPHGVLSGAVARICPGGEVSVFETDRDGGLDRLDAGCSRWQSCQGSKTAEGGGASRRP